MKYLILVVMIVLASSAYAQPMELIAHNPHTQQFQSITAASLEIMQDDPTGGLMGSVVVPVILVSVLVDGMQLASDVLNLFSGNRPPIETLLYQHVVRFENHPYALNMTQRTYQVNDQEVIPPQLPLSDLTLQHSTSDNVYTIIGQSETKQGNITFTFTSIKGSLHMQVGSSLNENISIQLYGSMLPFGIFGSPYSEWTCVVKQDGVVRFGDGRIQLKGMDDTQRERILLSSRISSPSAVVVAADQTTLSWTFNTNLPYEIERIWCETTSPLKKSDPWSISSCAKRQGITPNRKDITFSSELTRSENFRKSLGNMQSLFDNHLALRSQNGWYPIDIYVHHGRHITPCGDGPVIVFVEPHNLPQSRIDGNKIYIRNTAFSSQRVITNEFNIAIKAIAQIWGADQETINDESKLIAFLEQQVKG